MRNLALQGLIIGLKFFDSEAQAFGLFLGAQAKFLNDFDDSPETHDNDD
jgi:hypothetical protein